MMSVCGRRFLLAGAVGVLVVASLYPLVKYLGGVTVADAQTGSRWQRRYWEATSRADNASYVQDWKEAGRAYGEIAQLLPHSPVSRYNHAYALAHLGRTDEALAELRRAVDFGWAGIERLKSDPVFSDVCGIAGFEKLLVRAKEITDESVAVYVPPGLDRDGPVPLIITFHGMGENPHSHIQSWEQAADRLGVVVAAPRGIQRIVGASEAYSFRWTTKAGNWWGSDFSRCQERLQDSIAVASQRGEIDLDRIVLAGYSQGGAVALALLADAPERFRGAVVEATAYSPRTLERWKRTRTGRTVRIQFIVHEFDRMRPMGERAYRELKAAGINARLKVVRGADHELPMDSGARQIEAVRFVLAFDAGGRQIMKPRVMPDTRGKTAGLPPK